MSPKECTKIVTGFVAQYILYNVILNYNTIDSCKIIAIYKWVDSSGLNVDILFESGDGSVCDISINLIGTFSSLLSKASVLVKPIWVDKNKAREKKTFWELESVN